MEGREHETYVEGKRAVVSWEDWQSFFLVLLGICFFFWIFTLCIPYFLFFSFILLTKFVFYSSYDWSRLLLCNRLLHLWAFLNNYRGKGGMFLVLANDMKL